MAIRTVVTLVFFAFLFNNSYAQNPTPAGRIKSTMPVGGRVTAEVNVDAPGELHQLVGGSKLILDGTILSVLPSISVHPNPDVPLVETDSVVSVNSVIYGDLPAGVKKVLLSQLGGSAGKWQIDVPDDPLVLKGERYIFFLVPDDRTSPPNTSDAPRYYSLGFWAGKVRVGHDGKVKFPARAAANLHANDDVDVAVFLTSVRQIIHSLYDKIPYPKNAPLLKPPPNSITPH